MEHFIPIVHAKTAALPMLSVVCLAIWPFHRRGRMRQPAERGASAADEALRLAMLGRLSEAKQRFEEAEAAGVRDPALYYNWGLVLSHLGEHVPACEMYRTALELDETLVDAAINWGVSLAALGRHEEACRQYERAERLDSGVAAVYFNWGTSLFAMGRMEDACAKLQRAAEVDEKDVQVRYNLGICLHRLGRSEEAAEHLKSFIERAGGRFLEQVKRARELLGDG